MKTLFSAILLLAVIVSARAQTGSSPAGSSTANTVRYEDKTYTIKLGAISNDQKGKISIEIITDEEIVIPMKNGAMVAPIMMSIVAGGKTIAASDEVSVLRNSMTFNFKEIPDRIIVYGNDGKNAPVVTFNISKDMIKTAGEIQEVAATPTKETKTQPATQQSRPAVQQAQPQAQSTGQQNSSNTQKTQSTPQQTPEVKFDQKGAPLGAKANQQNEKLRRWRLEAGLSVGILVPEVDNAMGFAGGTLNLGFYLGKRNFLSINIGGGGYSKKIDSFNYTKTYANGTSEKFTDGVVRRSYTSAVYTINWNYAFNLSDKLQLRVGPSLGIITLSATDKYIPKPDNAPSADKKTDNGAAFGASTGLIWNFGERGFFDGGYKILFNEGLYIDKKNIPAPAHQISLTIGWRF